MMTRNWLKVFSVFFAILLWAYVVSTLPREYTQVVPLEFILPDKISMVSSSAKEVTLIMRGPRAFLHQFKKQLIHLPVDLRQFNGPFDYPLEVPLTAQMLPIPVGVDIRVTNPSILRVQLARKSAKKMPLRATLTGEFSKGLTLEKLKISPPEVVVSGPEKEIEQLQFVPLEALDRSQLADHGEIKLNQAIDRSKFQLSPAGPYKVEYQLHAQGASLSLKKIKIRFVSHRQVVKSSESYASLEVLVDDENRTFKKEEVKIYADLPQDRAGKFSVDLRADLPDDVHLVHIYPKRISVTLK